MIEWTAKAGRDVGDRARGGTRWSEEGEEPDPRFSLANERTFLAYNRTALALIVAGLAVSGAQSVADASAWVHLVGVPMMALGAAMASESHRRLETVQRALRLDEDIPPPPLARLLSVGVTALALAAVLVMILAARDA